MARVTIYRPNGDPITVATLTNDNATDFGAKIMMAVNCISLQSENDIHIIPQEVLKQSIVSIDLEEVDK